MKVDGVFFDLDGTLWDNNENCFLGWREVLIKTPEKIPYPSIEDIRKCAGKTTPEVCAQLLSGIPMPRAEELIETVFESEVAYTAKNGGVLYDRIEETLAALAERYSVFLVSNCDPDYLEAFFENHGLRKYFRDAASYTGEHHAKADNILELVKRYDIKCPVYVGDTIMDYQATTVAGVPFIHAAYGFGEVPEARYRIEALGDLPEYLMTLDL